MGTFSEFLESKKITPPMIVRVSSRIEATSNEGRTVAKARATKRRKEPTKTYADANLAKPPAGRGVGLGHIEAAIKDAPLPRKVRAKLVRAINEIVSKKKGAAVDTKALFGEVPMKKGEKVEKTAAA